MIEKVINYIREKNALLIYLIITMFIIIMLIILAFIWSNTFSNESDNINKYNSNLEESYKNLKSDEYSRLLSSLLKNGNEKSLYSYIDLTFLNNNALNEDNIVDYLKNNKLIGINPVIYNCTIEKRSSDIYVYRYAYRINGLTKYVNLVETFPEKFTISFEQDNVPSNLEKTIFYNYNNINFEIKTISRNVDNIKYSIKITNGSDNDFNIDLNDTSTFQLIVGEDKINLSSIVTDNNFVLTPRATINKELFYDVTFDNQNNVKGIVINNVKFGDLEDSITILF